MVVSGEASALPCVSPAVFAGTWPGVLGGPGHLAGAAEGAYNCSWTCFTAGQTASARPGAGGQEDYGGGEAGRAAGGCFWLRGGCCRKPPSDGGCSWAVPACQAPCGGAALWLGQPSVCCTRTSPRRWAVTPPAADVPPDPRGLGARVTGAGKCPGGPPERLVVAGTLVLVQGSSAMTPAWKYQ